MTEENRKLLLKDLSSRLTYGVKIMIDKTYLTEDMIKGGYDKTQELYGITCEGNMELLNMNYHMPVESIKPYLFPISSMDKKQEKYIRSNYTFGATYELFDWLDKNHFDYRGLIEKGLAIDATNKNIY